MSDNLNLWLNAARSYTLSLSAIPYLLGAFLASVKYNCNMEFVVLGLLGVLLIHASINMLDDYHDWTSGMVKAYNDPETPQNTRKHKAYYLEQGLFSPKKVLFGVGFCWTMAILIGLFLAWQVGFVVIQIAALGALLAIAYTLPPLELNQKGLGELTIGIIFGPLVTLGAYAVAGGNITDGVCIFSSVIMGILIANVAHTHSILDFEADLKNNKRTLSVCLLSKNKAIYIQLLLYILAYLILFWAIDLDIFTKKSLLALFTLPLALELNELLFHKDNEPKLWYGPITHLKDNEDNYFMLRICMARNIVIFFAFFLALTYYLYG
ncbi:prenyltransferase [bacterium]|nr:prenyltransferase [bacterium]